MELALPFFFLGFWDGKRKHNGMDDEDRIIEDEDEMDEGELNPEFAIFSYQNLTPSYKRPRISTECSFHDRPSYSASPNGSYFCVLHAFRRPSHGS